jgi:hypothetical protein
MEEYLHQMLGMEVDPGLRNNLSMSSSLIYDKVLSSRRAAHFPDRAASQLCESETFSGQSSVAGVRLDRIEVRRVSCAFEGRIWLTQLHITGLGLAAVPVIIPSGLATIYEMRGRFYTPA